ncbi:MAG: hypothetical protein JW715_01885 [Sedimentisphaerales bacterium]|nr:hypothetical protein [Sedimentisphaerales bacterium]
MRHIKTPSFTFVFFFAIILAGTAFAVEYPLQGRVYEGVPWEQDNPIDGVTVELWGANESGNPTQYITGDQTDTDGFYRLILDTGDWSFNYYIIWEKNKSGYYSSDARSVSGTVLNDDQIQFASGELTGDLTGNKFWDMEGEEPPENNPPIADADGPYSTQVGTPVLLDGSGSYDPDTGDSITGYQWYWFYQGNYNPINGVQTTPTIWWVPPVAGQFTLKLEVTDSHGEIDTDTSTVDIQEEETPEGTGTLDGYKRDADTGEGLENWRIFIDLDGNGEWNDGEPSDLTNSNGYYQINEVDPGTYRVCEEMQDGWEPAGWSSVCVEGITIIEGTTTTQDFHNRRTDRLVIISGIKYNDLNDNGKKDPNEPGLPGWEITLEDGDNNLLAATTTDTNGWYSFTITEPGTYYLDEVQKPGWRQTEPVKPDGTPGLRWWILSELPLYYEDNNNNFGNYWTGTEPPERTGSIMIIKDALQVSTVPFDFTGDLGPFTLKIGESKVFSQLPPGQYTVTESLPGGGWKMGTYQITGDFDGGTTSNPTAQSITIDLDAGEDIILIIYNYREEGPELGTGSIRGVKFNDFNGNRQRDPAEPGLPYWEIQLWQDGSNKALIDTTMTDASGAYAFESIHEGEYEVHEIIKSGWDWTQTYPGGSGYHSISLESGRIIENLDFGNRRYWWVDGQKINDPNGDGQPSIIGNELAGWRIYLDLNDNGIWDAGEPNGVTGSDGLCRFRCPEQAGDSVVREVMQPGWEQTVPGPPSYSYRFGSPAPEQYPDGAYAYFINHRTGTELPEGTYYTSDVCFNVEITDPTGTVEKLILTGPMTQRVYVGPNGEASDAGGNGREEVTTELVGLNLSGISPSLGPVKVSLNTNMPSMGQIEERTNNTPGILDIPPFTATGDADSFFDVFFQFEVGGTVLLTSPSQPIRLTSVITHLPPEEDYSDISQTKVELLDQNGQPTGFYFGPVTSCQQPPPGGEGGGSVVVIKEATPADDTQFLFCADFSPGNFFDTLCIYLTDPSINTWTFNNPNTLQKVSETVPSGWTLTDITITGDMDNGSIIDKTNAAVDVDFDEGENIVITFKNEKTVSGGYDFGDAPAPYPEASHELGGPYLGPFGDLPDPESGMQRDIQALGDDNDANGDDENGLLSINLVKTPGAWSTWELKGYFNLSSDAKFGLWIDLNGDKDWDDPNELRATFGFCGFGAGPQDWYHAMGAFQIPTYATTGTTYARIRVYGDCNATVSPSGAGGPGEVEDYAVEIKADGPGVPPGGIVHGYKWNDLDDNGQWHPNEPALSGLTFWLDINNNGQEDAGDMYEQTDATGHFRFTGVPAGTYTLGEQLQTGWIQTTPGGTGTYAVTVQPGQGTFPMMFGNRQSGGPTYDGKICGSKWNDINGDGMLDLNESFLSGWTIYLDINHNGKRDSGEPSQLTDATGSFEFTGLAVGSYTVAEEMKPGWIQTWPGGTKTHIISVPTGSVQPACVLFGNQQTGAGPLFDWGDAPDPNYTTLRASNGAYHVIVPGIFLGSGVDPEIDGLPTPDALGDDYNGSDDEDGVAFLTPLLPSQQATVEIFAASSGYLDAWIDFDADGSWSQVSDQIFPSEVVSAGSNILNFNVPAGAAIDIDTYARFRFSSAGSLAPDGPAQDGEVEDYHIMLGEDGPYVPGEGRGPHIKWSQPPIEIDPNVDAPPVFCGWGEPARSTEQSGSKRQWRMDADDFRCLGTIPVTRIRWWGSYKSWQHPEPPELQPEFWHIGFWANQAEGIAPDESFPERLVWSLEIPVERIHFEPVGLAEFPQKTSEMCFLYEVTLEPEEWFHQREFESNSDIFWITIIAVYPADVPQVNMWGWTTRSHIWGNGAVMPAIMGDWPTFDERLFPGRIYPIENDLLCGQNQPYDLCFELLTEHPWVKWDLPFTGIREWRDYSDHKSMALEQDEELLSVSRRIADDWICESQGPVTAIAWHGSYIGYGYEACKCEQTPEPRRPDYFLLSIRENNAAAIADLYNIPGETIWEFRAENYDEVLVGYDKNPEGEPNEPVFRYSVRLPEDAWFRQETPESIYWFSVVAVFEESSGEIPYDWGWTNHSHTFGSAAMSLDAESQTTSQWQPALDNDARPVDMSFMLFTAPEITPIAHWKFDETEGTTAIDSTGRHHGRVYGGTWAEGIIDGALNLNGLNGYVDCGDSDLLGPEQMTLTMWLNPEHSDGTRYIISRGREADSLDYAVIRWLDGEIEFTISQNGVDPVSVVSQEQVPLSRWSHVAITCSGDSASVYINGTFDTSAIIAPKSPYDESRFVLGSLLGETRFYNGRIDDIRIYDGILSSEQIIALATTP